MEERITMSHGSGGVSTGDLIGEIFAAELGNEYLNQMEDSTVVPARGERMALTTDSFVVTPVEFPGGDIGRLCVCGTVNDLLMSGARPAYLTCGFILEEGLPVETLRRVVHSMAETAKEAGVLVAAGDTKVVENHSGPDGGLIINTAGVGFLASRQNTLSPQCIREGDAVLLSGNLGDHHAAILGKRMGLENRIQSDNAPLGEMVQALLDSGAEIHEMRDVTRGGLATVLNEFAQDAGKIITLREDCLPVSKEVKGFAGILGLDPLYMGNEGKMICIVPEADAEKALAAMQKSRYGEHAAIIGSVTQPKEEEGERPALLILTAFGGRRVVGPLYGEGLPRIC